MKALNGVNGFLMTQRQMTSKNVYAYDRKLHQPQCRGLFG